MGLWTPEHTRTLLPALGVMLLLGILAAKWLGKKSERIRLIPIQVLACLLVALEIGKQVVSFSKGYDLYHLPFHICSLFIFLLPIMAFYRGKYRAQMNAVTGAFCASVFLLMLIYPNLIYSDGNIREFFTDYLSFHTVAFHNIVMFAFVLIAALQLHTPKKRDPKAVVLFTIGFCVVSSSMSQLLETNFANFYSCNIPVFENIRMKMRDMIGVVPTQILYVLIVSALTIGFVLMSYWFCSLCERIFRKKEGKIYA